MEEIRLRVVKDSGGMIWVILKPENSRNFRQIQERLNWEKNII